jgi:hypothetical protein
MITCGSPAVPIISDIVTRKTSTCGRAVNACVKTSMPNSCPMASSSARIRPNDTWGTAIPVMVCATAHAGIR